MGLRQRLFHQQAINRYGITGQWSVGVPQVQVAGTQAAQSHRMALGWTGRLEVRMFGGLFGHGVTSGNHKDFRLAGGAGGNRARQVFVAELTLRGLIGSGQVAVFIEWLDGHEKDSLSVSNQWRCSSSSKASRRCVALSDGCWRRSR